MITEIVEVASIIAGLFSAIATKKKGNQSLPVPVKVSHEVL